MKKKFLWAVACLAMVAACSKSKDSTPACNIITINSTGDDPTTFTYNSAGKPVLINYGNFKTELTYTGNTVNILLTNNGAFWASWVVLVNSRGLAEKVRVNSDETGTNWVEQVYTYNGDQLQKMTNINSSGVVGNIATYTWENGNPVRITFSNGDPEIRMEYYTNKPYDPKVYLVEGNYWETARPKNLLKKAEYGGVEVNKTYEFDAAGKVVAQTEAQDPNKTTFLYTYDCDR